MPSPTEQWMQPYLPAGATGSGLGNMSMPVDDAEIDERLKELNLIPWGALNPWQAQVQLDRLQRAYEEMYRVISGTQMTAAQRKYLEETDYEELPPQWKQMADELMAAEAYLPAVESALREGQQAVAEYSQPSMPPASVAGPLADVGYSLGTRIGTRFAPDIPWKPEQQSAPSIEPVVSSTDDPYLGGGVSSNPLIGGAGDEMLGEGYTLDQLMQYYEGQLIAQELDNAYRQAQIAALNGTPVEKAMAQLELGQMMRDFTNAPKDRAEEMRRYNQEWAARQAAQAYAQWIQRKQLENQMADNYNAMQSNSWQFIANNALPAGTGFVPGFGPDSRLAQIMGPSFGGLPTITLDTPTPTAGYDWAAQYLGGR